MPTPHHRHFHSSHCGSGSGSDSGSIAFHAHHDLPLHASGSVRHRRSHGYGDGCRTCSPWNTCCRACSPLNTCPLLHSSLPRTVGPLHLCDDRHTDHFDRSRTLSPSQVALEAVDPATTRPRSHDQLDLMISIFARRTPNVDICKVIGERGLARDGSVRALQSGRGRVQRVL
jgi:hypothetical protein